MQGHLSIYFFLRFHFISDILSVQGKFFEGISNDRQTAQCSARSYIYAECKIKNNKNKRHYTRLIVINGTYVYRPARGVHVTVMWWRCGGLNCGQVIRVCRLRTWVLGYAAEGMKDIAGSGNCSVLINHSGWFSVRARSYRRNYYYRLKYLQLAINWTVPNPCFMYNFRRPGCDQFPKRAMTTIFTFSILLFRNIL